MEIRAQSHAFPAQALPFCEKTIIISGLLLTKFFLNLLFARSYNAPRKAYRKRLASSASTPPGAGATNWYIGCKRLTETHAARFRTLWFAARCFREEKRIFHDRICRTGPVRGRPCRRRTHGLRLPHARSGAVHPLHPGRPRRHRRRLHRHRQDRSVPAAHAVHA